MAEIKIDQRTKEILEWLNEMANYYSLRLDKHHKQIALDANKIISRVAAGPTDEIKNFDIPPELENAKGYIPGVDA